MIKLKSYRIDRFYIDILERPGDPDVEIFSGVRDDLERVQIVLSIGEKSGPFGIFLDIEGMFQGEVDDRQEFLETHGFSILLGIAREIILSMTAKTSLGGFILPIAYEKRTT